jgi:uncharacterized protein with von Willebrand factor type A (vWA) domain
VPDGASEWARMGALVMDNIAEMKRSIERLEAETAHKVELDKLQQQMAELKEWKAVTESQLSQARWVIGALILALIGSWVPRFIERPAPAPVVQKEKQ